MNFKKQYIKESKEIKYAGIDIDGCIANYPLCWINFVNGKLGENFKDLNEMKNKLTYNAYRMMKNDYRTSGYKKTLPVISGVVGFIEDLQKNNFHIVLMSARPKETYPQIEMDTHYWLDRIGIKNYDLVWDSQKHWRILQEYPYLQFMIEDNAETANQVARLGYRVYVIDNIYNRQKLEKNCFRVTDFNQILKNEVIE